jgi:hypothetical protein
VAKAPRCAGLPPRSTTRRATDMNGPRPVLSGQVRSLEARAGGPRYWALSFGVIYCRVWADKSRDSTEDGTRE